MAAGIEGVLRALAALALGGGGLLASYTLADRLFSHRCVALRWTATAITGTATATFGFHGLVALGGFRLVPALIATASLLVATFAARRPGFLPAAAMRADLTAMRMFAFPDGAGTWRHVLSGAALTLLGAVALRALMVPVVAWDSLTYHAVKAALWVQGGGPIELAAPGGWSLYGSYFGGGEALTAWAMLPLHGDLLAGLPDAVVWLWLGVATVAAGGELGLSRRSRWVAMIYVLAMPAAMMAVGSLYVDTTLAMLLVAGLAMALHAIHQEHGGALALALAALGLACGVKLFAWPVAAGMSGVLAVLWAVRVRRPRAWLGWPVGLAAMVGAVAPWLAHNVARTGLPFSPVPLAPFGWTLGEANPVMRWYLDRPELADAGGVAELRALGSAFGVPPLSGWNGPTLGPWTLVLGLAALPGWFVLARRRPRSALLVTALLVPLALAYAAGGLRPTRLIWAPVSGRYLLAGAAVVVLLALLPLDRKPGAHRWPLWVAGLAVIYHAGLAIVGVWELHEILAAGLIGAGVVALTGAVHLRRRAPLPLSRETGVVLAVVLVALLGLARYRSETLESALRTRQVLHPSPRYWVDAALRLDRPAESQVIAFTAGPYQDADNQVLYPFLGRRLQNRLVYVPVTADGSIVDPVRATERAARADPRAWLRRLDDAGVNAVVAFGPPSLEQSWMEASPDRFERIGGDGRRWGVYGRLRPSASRTTPARRSSASTRVNDSSTGG